MTDHLLKNNNIKKSFPIFEKHKDLVFLDNASTTQKPKILLDKIVDLYSNSHANVQRGLYDLSVFASESLENSREYIQGFINASQLEEIVFTKNATEAFNLLAYSLSEEILLPDDEVIISVAEHHSNFLPWQKLSKSKNIKLKIAKVTKEGDLDIEHFKSLLSSRTKIISLIHLSNVTGSLTDIKSVVEYAKEVKAITIIDACQSIAHIKIDVQALGVDFLAFSAHKIYGPPGVGVLYGKKTLLDKIPPMQLGGGIIEEVTTDSTIFLESPYKFEAGTPAFVDIAAFKDSLEFVSNIGLDNIFIHEKLLKDYLMESLSKLINIEILARPKNHHAVVSFNIKGIHPHDIATILNSKNVSVRVGHHCAQPLFDFLEVKSAVRVSLAIYNSYSDIDRLIEALLYAQKILK